MKELSQRNTNTNSIFPTKHPLVTHPCFLLFSSRHPGHFHHQHTECDRSKGPSTKDNIATSQIETGMDVRGHSLSLLSTRLDNLLIRGAQSVKKNILLSAGTARAVMGLSFPQSQDTRSHTWPRASGTDGGFLRPRCWLNNQILSRHPSSNRDHWRGRDRR